MKQELLARLTQTNEEEQTILDGAPSIDRTLYMQSKRNVINSKKLIDDGKLITFRPHTRFIRFPRHTHDFVEIVYMCKGETVHFVNDKTIRLQEGETLILNQHATQEILPAGKNDIAVNFIVMPVFFEKVLKMMEEETPLRRFIIECIAGKKSTDGYLLFKTANVTQIENLFENLIVSFLEESPDKQKTNELTLQLLLLEFINRTELIDSVSSENVILLETYKYIEHNFRSGTLSELANHLHYDLHWLSREIKRKTGKNFTSLLQEKRLSRACYLLTNSNMRISDIAGEIGYNNTNYFHKIFEAKYGSSPKKFRTTAKLV